MKQAHSKASRRTDAKRIKRLGRPVTSQNPIVKLLEDNCLSVTDIARGLGISSQAVSQVIVGKTISGRAIAAIATATGKSVAEIESIIQQVAMARLAKQPA
jgi:predicted transcriptional regulator